MLQIFIKMALPLTIVPLPAQQQWHYEAAIVPLLDGVSAIITQ